MLFSNYYRSAMHSDWTSLTRGWRVDGKRSSIRSTRPCGARRDAGYMTCGAGRVGSHWNFIELELEASYSMAENETTRPDEILVSE